MSDFIQVAGWSTHNHPTTYQSFQHLRSLSSASPKSSQKSSRPASKSISTSPVPTMASIANASIHPISRSATPFDEEDGKMSTLPDPRSRAMSPLVDSSPASPSQHPDLSNEVATLSNKLIRAINHQTSLDDTLSAARHELDTARSRIRVLEKENESYVDMVSRGILIKSSVADAEKAELRLSLAEERRQRREIEKEKRGIEQELENLTTALFEEANKMVIMARESAQQEHDLVQRRNDQLSSQLADTESLLRSHQEQLAELKQVMERMTEDHEDQTNQTAPSTPGFSKFDFKEESSSEPDGLNMSSAHQPVSPSYPTSFTHLLQTVLRTDLAAYDDFISLLRMSKNVPVSSRASSGSYGSIGLGLGLGGYAPSSGQQGTANGSMSSLSTAATPGSSPVTPTTPASTVSNSSNYGPTSTTPLKDTKFYKRALAEDIEPTLRLDNAPGLSWLSKRSVLSAICDGTLVVEPMPTSANYFAFSCSMCGETRKDEGHTRTHRFRTSESENSQRYPLCKYCLGRVRSTCDFMGFLRILKDGHWRTEDEESEKAAWEETVRLRENMFWCRIGGGVIPIHHPLPDSDRSPRASVDERKKQERQINEEVERTGEIQPKDVTPVPDVVVAASAIPVTTLVASEVVTEISSEQLPEELPQQSPAQIPEQTLEQVSEQLPEQLPAPDKEPENISESVPESVHENVSEKRQVENEPVEVLPSTVQEATPEKKQTSTRESWASSSSLKVLIPEQLVTEESKRLSGTIQGPL